MKELSSLSQQKTFPEKLKHLSRPPWTFKKYLLISMVIASVLSMVDLKIIHHSQKGYSKQNVQLVKIQTRTFSFQESTAPRKSWHALVNYGTTILWMMSIFGLSHLAKKAAYSDKSRYLGSYHPSLWMGIFISTIFLIVSWVDQFSLVEHLTIWHAFLLTQISALVSIKILDFIDIFEQIKT